MLKKTTFKIEMEVEMVYEESEGVATTPYTSFKGYINNSQELIVSADNGAIQDFNITKVIRHN